MIVIVPMAGRGARFADQGIPTPKPLIAVRGRPMLAWALDGIADLMREASRVIFVVLEAHEEQYRLREFLAKLVGERAEVITVPGVTEGQLCTVMAALSAVDRDEEVLVASCDTYVPSKMRAAIATRRDDCHGIISVVHAPGDRWSFAKVDKTGAVVQVAEKERISDLVSTGLYYFRRAGELSDVAAEMVARGEKTRGEYYVIPVYERYIRRGWRVDVSLGPGMHDMGTPDALLAFLALGADLHHESQSTRTRKDDA